MIYHVYIYSIVYIYNITLKFPYRHCCIPGYRCEKPEKKCLSEVFVDGMKCVIMEILGCCSLWRPADWFGDPNLDVSLVMSHGQITSLVVSSQLIISEGGSCQLFSSNVKYKWQTHLLNIKRKEIDKFLIPIVTSLRYLYLLKDVK